LCGLTLIEEEPPLPIYTYQCQACRTVRDVRQSFSDAPLTTCEACRGELRKLLSAPAIVFKGSGFYNTDYRGSNGTAANDASKNDSAEKTDSSDGAKTGSSSTKSSTESKPEASTSTAKSETTPAGASAS
jgi:putative FmdB family regulatory protein